MVKTLYNLDSLHRIDELINNGYDVLITIINDEGDKLILKRKSKNKIGKVYHRCI